MTNIANGLPSMFFIWNLSQSHEVGSQAAKCVGVPAASASITEPLAMLPCLHVRNFIRFPGHYMNIPTGGVKFGAVHYLKNGRQQHRIPAQKGGIETC